VRIAMTFSLSVVALGACALAEMPERPLAFLDQGWSPSLREQFYFTPQGSHMMPADWFAALEQPDGGGRFGDPAYLARYGFLAPDGPSELNPDGYPIGFAVEPDAEGPGGQVGLTCAACHTATVEVNGEPLRIDGAPAHLDMDSFYQSLAQAVSRTLLDAERFARFASTLGATDETAATELKAQLAAFNMKLAADAVLRRPALASGYGRVDALTQIVSSMAVRDQGEPANLYPVAAPTSYPALWLTPELEYVQWNPIASSPIARNGGQVLGVFGKTNLAADAGEDAFRSTMLLQQLHQMELWLKDLEPPVWDEARMGPIDTALAEQGSELFVANCAGCHNMAPYERTDPADNFFGKTFITIGRIPYQEVGTDPTYMESLLTRSIRTNSTTAPLFGGREVVPAAAFFGGAVAASIRLAFQEAELTQEEIFAINDFRFRTGEDGRPVPVRLPAPTTLKAGPLAAVWATGPYLHNGSVPTIYELLLPPEERRTVFWTGGRALDLQRLGYQSDDAPGRFRFDTSLPGNGNGGHEFPAGGLSPNERLAVIEYLKTQ
jgi:mono/diheme cytochrome c family protein